ncbi:MAG: GHKL domain-containing protein [Desulfosarcina sp.]|nr:GHKL domain-containing protein [Desulfobacterales bacterium]
MPKKEQRQLPYYRSLTLNMTVAIIVVSFIPVFLVGSAIYYNFYASYREKVYAHLEEMIQKHKQHIDDFLVDKLADIRFMARNLGYANLSDEAFLQAKLASLQRNYRHVFVDLGVVNSAGRQVAYAGPFKLAEADYADTDWFQQAMRKDYVISDVFLGLRRLPHFIVAVKSTIDGEPWILRATIDFVVFNDLVENIRVGETGFAYILNRGGEFQTKPLIDFIPSKGCYGHFFDCEEELNDEVTIMERADEDGKESIYVTALLKDKDWLLVYRQESDDAFSDLKRARDISAIIFLIGGLSIVIMASILSVRQVRRIKVADREKELMNQQVIETGKLASIGELAAGIAHEINNPVAIMVEEAGWVQDLLEEEDFARSENLDEFDRALKQINTQGKRCKEITHKLLSFARKTDARIQEFSVNELIAEVVGLTEQRAKYAKVAITPRLENNLPAIQASPSEMQQVLLNLINNAVDAMEKQGGLITVATRRKEGRIVITVTDNGPGIPPANLDRIFDPFYTTKPVGKGTGLGLSICYGIIKKMGGDINVDSAMDEGTTFTVEIPVRQESVEKSAEFRRFLNGKKNPL